MNASIDLSTFIPSRDVRDYITEIGWEFSDRDIAALLIHGYSSNRPIEKLFSGLRTLQDETSDQKLRLQIAAYLDEIGGTFEAFQKNEDRNCIYVLKIQEEEESYYLRIHPSGYFFDFEMAREYGRKAKAPFQVEKHPVGATEFIGQYEDGEYLDYEIDSLSFNADGIAYIFSSQFNIPQPFMDQSEQFFVDAFVELPNPYETGDLVRFVGMDEYGIVETSCQQWKNSMEKYRKDKWNLVLHIDEKTYPIPLEFADARIRVVFLNDDGTFSHRHINPIDLERYEPQGDEKDPMDQLLQYASYLYRGEGSLDDLYYYTMEYRESRQR